MKKKILSLSLVLAFFTTISVNAATTAYCETCWETAKVSGSSIGSCDHPNFPSCNARVYRYKCSVNPSGHFGTVLCDAGHYN
jgi:hypothetical protein